MTAPPPRQRPRGPFTVAPAELKARQASKIREIRGALIDAGFVALDKQAEVLGLSRSTAWNLLNGTYKSSGLSVTIINRMLAAPRLPPLVRTKILEYVQEKTTGRYGDSNVKLRRFSCRLVGSGAETRNDPQLFSPRQRSRLRPPK